MTSATTRLEDATLRSVALAPTVNRIRPLVVPGRLWQATVVAGDLLGGVAIVFSIPFVILAITLPIGLSARLLSWIVGLL